MLNTPLSLPLARRSVLGLIAGASAALASVPDVEAAQAAVPAPEPESRSLEELHRAALAEGGRLVIYAGGDIPNAYSAVESAFKSRFPGMNIRIVTDLSKYHDARIDLQLARGRLECDVAQLQTLQDFDRWKSEGQLLAYKPLDWAGVLPEYRDPDGAFVAIGIIAFSNVVNTDIIPLADAPRDALDYLNPQLKGKLVLTYPHDDDAVLFQFDRIVAAYGWEYIDKLMAQDVEWIRGTMPTGQMVAAGKKAATFTAAGSLAARAGSQVRFQLPKRDVFHSWGQTAAILREAPNKASAKLYMSWMCSKEATAARTTQWSVRSDVAPAGGYGPLSAYNTDPQNFRRFMQDRARIERLKTQFEELIGPAQGPNPTGAKGVYLVSR